MIGIKYQVATPLYDAYISKMQSRVQADLKKFMKRRNPADSKECHRFIKMYLAGKQYLDLVNKPVKLLRDFIDDVEMNFPQLKECRLDESKRVTSPLYLFLHYHFIKHGFESGFQEKNVKYKLPKDNLIEAIGIDVCPYCNRMFIYSSKSLRKVKVAQAELDHFYSKELFPYLAISKYNLVPSCHCCNGHGAKFTTDAYNEGMVNPYEISNADDYIDFRLRLKNVGVTSLDTLAESLSFKLIAKKPEMKSNINVLNLADLYQYHADYAAELYFKSFVKTHRLYRSSIKGILRRNGIYLTDDEIKRIIVGNYIKESDYGKRPLAKMMHDVSAELGLI